MTDKLSKTVLLAEDSTVTQDIVKLVLGQKGIQVDIASDGNQALEYLNSKCYDIAFIDFHLPNLDGVEVAKQYLSNKEGELVPRMVALTGDVDGLNEAQSDESYFDLIVAKPFKIDEILPIIESDESVARVRQQEVNDEESTKLFDDRPLPFQDLDLNILYFPRDFFSGARNAVSSHIAQKGAPSAIIIHEPPSISDLALMCKIKGLHLSAIIDFTGRLGSRADYSGDVSDFSETKLRVIVEEFETRRSMLHIDLHEPINEIERIIARIFLKNKPLEIRFDGKQKLAFYYNSIESPELIFENIEAMKLAGLVTSEFISRINLCPHCLSARILLREECSRCRSSNIYEENYLHHYRCAWQGPESEFKSGNDLICPKCRYELTHFGKDYDKPGNMIICNHCGHNSTDPEIGCVCSDCGEHSNGEQLVARDIEKIGLSTLAQELTENGRIVLGDSRRNFRFADLPMDMIVEINTMVKAYMEQETVFAFASVGYKNLRALESEHGVRTVDKAREMLVTLMREQLQEKTVVSTGGTYDYLLVQGMNRESLQQQLDTIYKSIASNVSLPLSAIISTFAAEDLGG